VGAIYIDKGYDFTYKILVKRIIKIHFDIDQLVDTEISFKSSLLEWAQKEKRELSFPVLSEMGQRNDKLYVVAVEIDGEIKARAHDYTIKGAEKLAAEKAWYAIIDNTNKA